VRPAITKPTIAIATSLQTTQGKKSIQILPTPIKLRRATTKNTNKA